jgi:flavin-dependent dehydrogenase
VKNDSKLTLGDGSRVGVIGGGPAGSFFSCFVLDMSQRVGLNIQVDLYEARDFSVLGPAGCNMSSCIVSEPLVQILATEGINLPPLIVRRGIDSYVLHMDVGNVCIETPLHEMRIAAVHRGSGPRRIKETTGRSFDGYLLELAAGKGANIIPGRVDDVGWVNDRPQIKTKDSSPQVYDLLVSAVGVNSAALKLFEGLGVGYQPPSTTRAHIREFCLGQETVDRYLGNSMHLFLPNIPRLDFACLIPKGEFATLVLLGQDIDEDLIHTLLDAPEVQECLPGEWFTAETCCHCSPRLNVHGAIQPFADRVVFIGDSGVSRLYKDGIGAAYRTAKAAAVTSIFEGVSADDFRRHFWPVCRSLSNDNRLGKVIFAFAHQIQKRRFARRGLVRMVSREQGKVGEQRRMSMVLWETFTGSAPYAHVFRHALHPFFLGRFLWDIAVGFWSPGRGKR